MFQTRVLRFRPLGIMKEVSTGRPWLMSDGLDINYCLKQLHEAWLSFENVYTVSS